VLLAYTVACPYRVAGGDVVAADSEDARNVNCNGIRDSHLRRFILCCLRRRSLRQHKAHEVSVGDFDEVESGKLCTADHTCDISHFHRKQDRRHSNQPPYNEMALHSANLTLTYVGLRIS